jgi:hypothetical protein
MTLMTGHSWSYYIYRNLAADAVYFDYSHGQPGPGCRSHCLQSLLGQTRTYQTNLPPFPHTTWSNIFDTICAWQNRCPINDLHSWREQIHTNAEWRPSHEHFEITNHALPDNAEALIGQFIRSTFVVLGRGLYRPTLKSVVLMLI